MIFNKHLNLIGRHAFLGPSKPAWINYDFDELSRSYNTSMAAERGTRLHVLAQKLIEEKVSLPDEPFTLNMYVNDCIEFEMKAEQILYYSDNCFGSPDAVNFNDKRKVDRPLLRVSDLKTGITPAKMGQLYVYAALFCLEYKIKPFEMDIELRIYQNDQVEIHEPDPDDVYHIVAKIIEFDKWIRKYQEEVT